MISSQRSPFAVHSTVGAHFGLLLLALALSGCGSGMGGPSAIVQPSPTTALAQPSPTVQQSYPLDHDPLVVQNEQGTFHIAAAVGVQPHELMFFYAMQSIQRGTPQVEAYTTGTRKDGRVYSGSLAVNSVQAMGQLAEFDTGVLHLAWNDQLGPNIVLAITPPGAKTAAWQMTLIDPQAVIDYGGVWWNWQSSGPLQQNHQVEMACPCGNMGFRLALLGRSPADVPPLYVKIDTQGTVSLLNEADWNAMWPGGMIGDPAVPTEDLEHPMFAPTYPPTPTFDPAAPTFTPSLPPPPPTALLSGLPSGGPLAASQAPGVLAIRPTIKDAGPDTPAFTAADVKRYHETSNPNGNFGIWSQVTGPVSLDNITFLRASELARQYPGLDTAGDGSRMLCFVEYSGTFQLSAPFGNTASQNYHHAQAVYDAHSGNLLLTKGAP